MFQNRLRGIKLGLISCVVALVLVILATVKVSAVITNDDVNAIASATTILISRVTDPGELEEELQKGGQLRGAGSGVIVAKQPNPDPQQGYDYYAATALHVIEFRTLYSLRTFDGKFHKINNCKPLPPINGQPRPDLFADNVIRFGKRNSDKDPSIEGFDLALIKFTTTEEYPVAPTSSATVKDLIKKGDSVLVSGWPTPPDSSNNIRRSRRSSHEIMTEIKPPKTEGTGGGYSLIYHPLSGQPPVAVGMSGGPVFNMQGEVVGIHGESYPGVNKATFESEGGGGAIKIQDLQQQVVEKMTQKLSFELSPIKPHLIELGRVNLQQADRLPQQEYKQVFDTSATDEFFQSLNSLKERYGCVDSYPNGTIRPRVPLIRSETTVDLNACLNKASKLVASATADTVLQQDILVIRTKLERLAREIADMK